MITPHVVKIQRPIDADTLALLREVDSLARAQGIEYFVGGAMARIVMLEHVLGNAAGRATLDIDIGICVAHWHVHEAFKQSLVDSGRFDRVPKSAHTLLYRASLAGHMQLDVIPFGDIEHPAARIAWPPDMDTVMNVAGFREASLAAVRVEVDTNLCIPFASLPALAVLKMLAWNDRHHDSKRDATDFLILLNSYANAGNLDRLYGQEAALLEAHEYDIDLAAAALLAKDALGVAGPEARRQIHGILDDDLRFQLFQQHMAFGDRAAWMDGESDPGMVRWRMSVFKAVFLS